MSKEQNDRLLTAIYENTVKAVESLEDMVKKVSDREFLKEITNQSEEYSIILRECLMMAKSTGLELKKHSFTKEELWSCLSIGTLPLSLHNPVRKFACLIYYGTTLGIPELIIVMCECQKANDSTLELAKKLKLMEESYQFEIKQFLCR